MLERASPLAYSVADPWLSSPQGLPTEPGSASRRKSSAEPYLPALLRGAGRDSITYNTQVVRLKNLMVFSSDIFYKSTKPLTAEGCTPEGTSGIRGAQYKICLLLEKWPTNFR